MQDSSSNGERDVPAPAKARSQYKQPTLLALGSFASVTRMMTTGPYADGMLGLMNMQ